MSEKVDDESSVVLQNYETDQIDPEELAAILEQAGGGGAGEVGCAQIVDADGNLITLTAEQLAEAGIDIGNIGEADVATLLQLAAQGGGSATSAVANTSAHDIGEGTLTVDETTGEIHVAAESASSAKSSSTKKRSADADDDVLVENETKKFKPNVIHGSIDGAEITELDEQTLASLVQSGSVKFVDESGNEIPASAVLAGAQAASATEERKIITTGSGSTKITRTSLGAAGSPSKTTSYALVGSEVEIKRGNRRVPATVRYVRQGVGYKVQFEDGRFEWVSENEVLFNNNPAAGNSAADADHEYLLGDDDEQYVEGPTAPELPSYKTSATVPPPVLQPQTPVPSTSSVAHPPAIASRRQMNGVSSRPAPNSSFGGGGRKQAAPPASGGNHQHNTSGGGGGKNSGGGSVATNFVCPICETKVFNKEPSYIVIRLPACDACAESKILVLDDNTK